VGRSTTLAYVAMGALGLSAVLSIVGLSSENSYHHLVQHALAGQYVSLQTAHSADHRVQTIGWLELALYAVTGIAFIVWFRDAYENVERRGITGLRWSAGWAVGAWFVPFLNLVRPKAMLNDIWRGSDPRLSAGSELGSESPPIFYGFWWGTWILGAIVARVAAANLGSAQSLSALSSATKELMFSDAISLVAAILAIAVVYSLTSRQRRSGPAVQSSLGARGRLHDCRCADASELYGNEAVAYLDHLRYMSEGAAGWLFRCPELLVEWIAPHLPQDASPENFQLRRQT
jgi:Domain of unknown function (DUF4328)